MNCRVVVDPKGYDWSKYKGADVLTPNLKEWVETGSPAHRFNAILLTRGADGVSLLRPGESTLDIPATNKDAIDVCGAGDTVTAALAACLAVGMDLETAARIANAAAGVVVGKMGTATCSREELEAAWKS
jgi:D-beta-D-heptose 7-phosphate kinase/D-beta-D-heptose 1-phosphate adenosyltransferase